MQRRFEDSIALFALLVSVGLILGYVENLFFPQGIAYGIKLGISNIVVIFSLMYLDCRQTILIAAAKVILSGLLFSSVTSIIYGICGVMLSILIMNILKKNFYPQTMSLIGISIAGSAVFNIGQVVVACPVLGTFNVVYLLVYMLPLSVVTGAITGVITKFLLNRLK